MTKSNGWVWIRGQQRPILSAREIKRGKNKGKIEVVLAQQKKIVNESDIVKWPEGEGNDKKNV